MHEKRNVLREWLEEPGYAAAFDCRVNALCEAFGLGESWLIPYLYFPFDGTYIGIGKYLLGDMVAWTEDNKPTPNMNDFEVTHFTKYGLGRD